VLNAAVIGVIGAVWFVLAYRWYGGFIDRRLFQPDDTRATPAHA
jgi:carbon starvation protein